MTFIRFLLALPALVIAFCFEACLYFIAFLFYLFKAVLWLFSPVIGDINWKTPRWLPSIKKGYQACWPCFKKWSWLVGTLIYLIVISYFGYTVYQKYQLNRAQPIVPQRSQIVEYSYTPTAKNLSSIGLPLYIRFSGDERPPVPLEEVGKEITDKITIEPKIEGVWKWDSEREIAFVPKEKYWPLNTTYQVTLDPNLLAEHHTLSQTTLSFTTPKFSYSIAGSEFYQSPTDSEEKMAIFKLQFNYPVDKSSLEKNLKLTLWEVAQYQEYDKDKYLKSLKYTLTYEPTDNPNPRRNNTTVYVKTENLKFSDVEQYVQLDLDNKVTSTLAGNSSNPHQNRLQTQVAVPNKYKLAITKTSINLVEDANSKLKQILTLQFNHRIDPADVMRNIEVWELPEGDYKTHERYYDQLNNEYRNRFLIDNNLLSRSKKLKLKLITDLDGDDKYTNTLQFEVESSQFKRLYLTLNDNVVGFGGFQFNEPYKALVTVPKYATVHNFASKGSVLSLTGEKRLSLVSRNVNKSKVELYRVIPSQVQHLISFNYNDFEDMNFGDLDEDHFTDYFKIEKELTGSSDELNYYDISLAPYLHKNSDEGEMRGIFLVKLYGTEANRDPKNKDQYYYHGSRFIIVTDLGVISKKSLDQSYDIFVQSIQNGEPVEDAKVTVLGVNGTEITSQNTDENGHVHFDPLSDYYEGIKPIAFVIQKDNDFSFLPINQYDRELHFSRFDIGGQYETLDAGELQSHMFSDRGIYRPGDTFHIGIILRTQNWVNRLMLENLPIEIDIYNAKNERVISNASLSFDRFGLATVDYATEQSSPTGVWTINMYLKDKKYNYRTLIDSTSVVIREFEPDQTKVALKLLPDNHKGWVHPNELRSQITAQTLFGTPASERRVTGQLRLEPIYPYFKEYGDYRFYQDRNVHRQYFDMTLQETQTDGQGVAALALPVKSFSGSYKATLLTDVFEPNSGRSVSDVDSIYVSEDRYLIGAKPDGDIDYIKRNSERNIKFIAINANLEQIDLNDLSITLLENRHISTLVKQPSGVYKYESKLKQVLVSETPFNISKEGTIYAIDSSIPADYTLQVKDGNKNIIYETRYNVVGTANVSRSLDRNAELEVKLSNTEYRPGDEIEISLKAPYTGSGIITIERDKVYAWKWFKMDTTSSIQTITLPEELVGNGYINIEFVRDLNSDEIYMSPLSYAVAPFRVALDKFDDKLKLTSPDLVKPGAELEMTVESNSDQSAIIFAVDEGILQVSNYKLKNPLTRFIRKKALSVRTFQILDMILPEFKHLVTLSAPGGDSEEADDMNGHLNPFQRKVDKPVAYWSDIIVLKAHTPTTVKYQLPDYFNGKVRVMVVSVGGASMGHAQTETLVRDQIVLKPNAPYFVAPGDTFEVSLNLTNTGGLSSENAQMPARTEVSVDLNLTDNLTLIKADKQSVKIGKNENETITYTLKVNSHLGNADLTFIAHYDDGKNVTRTVSTSVRPTTPFRIQTVMGRLDGKKQSFGQLRELYQPFSQNQASASYSPFVLSKGLALYLDNYPHYCSEQIISRAVPLLLSKKHPEFNLVTGKTIELSNLYQVLQTRQNSDGAIGLWYSTYNVDPFVTLYLVQYLLEAQEANLMTSPTLLKQANRYLNQIAASRLYDEHHLRMRSYAIYLLTRQQVVTTNHIASLLQDMKGNKDFDWESDVTALYLASSYKMLKMDKEADKLLKPIWKSMEKAYDNAWWSANYYDPLVMDSTKIYLITKHFPEKAADIPAQALENLVIMLNENRYTTQSTAMTLLALDAYSSSMASKSLSADDLTIQAASKEEDKKVELIAQLNGLLAKGHFGLNTDSLTITNNTSNPAWYMISQEGFDLNPLSEPIKRGFEIYREYTDEQGKVINEVVQGETINVTIRVRKLTNQSIDNVAIIDLLPGGFEVVQNKITQDDGEDNGSSGGSQWVSPIASQGSTWAVDFTDVREDRVLIYGGLYEDKILTFTYKIKATSVGTFEIPAIFGEAMYDRDVQAVSKSGETIRITAPIQ